MKLKEIIKNGFDEIIQYHIDKGELHSRAVADTQSFAQYLENQTQHTEKRLKEIIKEINYETIESQDNTWPDLEFWRGVDDFGTSVALNYGGGVDSLAGQESIVINQYDYSKMPSDLERLSAIKNTKSIKIDINKHPISLLGYRCGVSGTGLYYAFMGFLWQEIEGFKCGLQVRTVQNNSISMFSLNDFLGGDFSAFIKSTDGDKPAKIANVFPRKLSVIELYLRASQTGYPFNPYNNYWRYFEKENEFTEIVTYEFSIGIRTGKLSEKYTAAAKQIAKYQNSKTALKHLTVFTNQMICEGWQEKLRPIGMPVQMHKDAYDFDIWTGTAWTAEQTNFISERRLKEFEEKYNIRLPNSFFQYTRLLNGRQYNTYNMHFPINDKYTVKVKKFYNIDELHQTAKLTINKNPKHLWIGELEDKRNLGISIDAQSIDYQKIVIIDNSNIEVCDYTFEKFAKYAQGYPVQPEIFAAEEDDAEFLRKRLSEGWDYTTNYGYQNAVNQAAAHNSYEALEVLLEAGARLQYDYRSMTWQYDEKTMGILDKYHSAQ
jgi:hypothetical protein